VVDSGRQSRCESPPISAGRRLDIKSARCREELISALQMTNISVPARTKGRASTHTESYTACHLLSTLAAGNRLRFPMSVNWRDRPDVLIIAGGIQIGLEITEAIPAQFAALCAFSEYDSPGCWLSLDRVPWNAPKLSKKEMRTLLARSAAASSGWVGNEPEVEWAYFMQKVVDTKLKKLARPEFIKFSQNWLSIYDNLPMPNIDLTDAVAILRPLLKDCWECQPSFDTLFIECRRTIVKITASMSEYLVLNDLWSAI
jgi:hypothetical protein